RGEYLGLGPSYQLGALGDRNWSYAVDARRTTRADAPPATRPSPSRVPDADGTLAATGASTALTVSAVAAVVAAAVVHRAATT
ncbi:MAG: hypothetical protein ABIO67_00485, partial [Mycobacteriales bacterium]